MSNELMVLGDYTWDDVVGEQTRGGQDAYDVMGATFNAGANPAFNQALARRAAASRPAMHKTPLHKARDWQIGLGPVSGTTGQTVTVTVSPQCFFRGEKLIAQDSSTGGTSSTITGAFVGQKNQLPVGTGGGLPTFAFLPTTLGNGIKWDTCQPAITISLQISFSLTSTWSGVLFGKAILAA